MEVSWCVNPSTQSPILSALLSSDSLVVSVSNCVTVCSAELSEWLWSRNQSSPLSQLGNKLIYYINPLSIRGLLQQLPLLYLKVAVQNLKTVSLKMLRRETAKDEKSISICCFNYVGHTEMIFPQRLQPTLTKMLGEMEPPWSIFKWIQKIEFAFLVLSEFILMSYLWLMA